VSVLGGTQYEVFAFGQVDETGIATGQFGNEFDDLIQNFVERIGGSDPIRDFVKEINGRRGLSHLHIKLLKRRPGRL
jgi:hypothetical protein